MKKQLIVTIAYLFLLLALVALVEIIWNQEPEQPAIETPAATTTPAPTPTGPLTIQKSAAPRCARPEGGKENDICPYSRARRRKSQC